MARKYQYNPTWDGRGAVIKIGPYDDVYSLHYSKYVLKCLTCGRNFLSDRPHTKHCSGACKQKSYRGRKVETCA